MPDVQNSEPTPMSISADRPEISLVICTRNRAPQLGACLRAVSALHYDGEWEFVVVDNGSSDDTARVVADFAAASPIAVQYVLQPVKGLSNARNAGIARARGRVIAFTDDDCYVAPDLLQATVATFADARLGYASGRVLLHDPTDFPATISLSKESQVFEAGRYVVPGVFKGANMAFRREVLDAIGGFDPWFGSGAAFPAEDCDAAARASLAGWAGRYEPSMVVSHHHGRKADTIGHLYRDYDIGRGAYHAKLWLSCRAPRLALRGWAGLLRRIRWRPVSGYWETYGALRYAWTWWKHGRPSSRA
jgi:glycosyltransferase involved in cell wall biosynthesis